MMLEYLFYEGSNSEIGFRLGMPVAWTLEKALMNESASSRHFVGGILRQFREPGRPAVATHDVGAVATGRGVVVPLAHANVV